MQPKTGQEQRQELQQLKQRAQQLDRRAPRRREASAVPVHLLVLQLQGVQLGLVPLDVAAQCLDRGVVQRLLVSAGKPAQVALLE